MKSKKKFLGVYYSILLCYGSLLWVNLVQGGHSLFNFFKVGYLKKSLGNPGLNILKYKLYLLI